MKCWSFWTRDHYQHTKEAVSIMLLGLMAEGAYLALKYAHKAGVDEEPELEQDLLYPLIPLTVMACAAGALRLKYWCEERYAPKNPYLILHGEL